MFAVVFILEYVISEPMSDEDRKVSDIKSSFCEIRYFVEIFFFMILITEHRNPKVCLSLHSCHIRAHVR